MQGIAAVECLHALGERRRFEIKQMRSPVEKLGDFAGRSEHDAGRRDQRRDGNHGALAGGERGEENRRRRNENTGWRGGRGRRGRLLRDVHGALGNKHFELRPSEFHVERSADRTHIDATGAHDKQARGIFRHGALGLALP